MSRAHGMIMIGDVIEFKDRPAASGIITNMMNMVYGEVPECVIGDPNMAAMVVHQASDGQYAVWEVENLGEFIVTFRRRSN